MKALSKKRVFLKFRQIRRNVYNMFDPVKNVKLNEIQTTTISIIRKIINNPDATLLIAPISQVSYVQYKHYFIRFADNAAIITNGKFSYYVSLPYPVCNNLRKHFNLKVEERRLAMEQEYDRNTLANFDDILKSL
jgi:hypothetical protein